MSEADQTFESRELDYHGNYFDSYDTFCSDSVVRSSYCGIEENNTGRVSPTPASLSQLDTEYLVSTIWSSDLATDLPISEGHSGELHSSSDDDVTGCSDDNVTVCSDDDVTGCSDDDVSVCSDDDVTICSDDDVTFCSDDDVSVCSDDDVSVCSDDDVSVCSDDDVSVCSDDEVNVTCAELLRMTSKLTTYLVINNNNGGVAPATPDLQVSEHNTDYTVSADTPSNQRNDRPMAIDDSTGDVSNSDYERLFPKLENIIWKVGPNDHVAGVVNRLCIEL